MIWWRPWWIAVYAGLGAGALALRWLLWWKAIGAALVVALGVVVLWAGWWRLPRWQADRLGISDVTARADVEDNFRKTITQAIGGALVLIAAGIAYYGTRQTLQGSHDLLISQQVSKGFEDLGSAGDDKLMVRLGGIYALEGVMNASAQYHQPALEALCAFVRDGTKTYTGDGPPATDIQASLTVMGRRAAGEGLIDLTGARIPKAHFLHANLTDAHLIGANLTHADLTDANLTRADLTHANLTGVNLTHAELGNANLTRAALGSANLTGANLNNATLIGPNLNNANLTDTNISQGQLENACGTGTKLPPGLTIKPCSQTQPAPAPP